MYSILWLFVRLAVLLQLANFTKGIHIGKKRDDDSGIVCKPAALKIVDPMERLKKTKIKGIIE